MDGQIAYEERLKEMQLTTVKERRERGDLIIIYKLTNNLEETDRKDLMMKGLIFEGTRKNYKWEFV